MNQLVFQTSVACRTPGTAPIAVTAAGETGPEPGAGSGPCTSAPVTCQEAVISPRAMPWLTIPAKVARLSVSTSANAGSAPVSVDRAARDSATKPVAPVAAGEQRQQPADDQRIEPQHDHDDRDGDQDRHDGEVQVDAGP